MQFRKISIPADGGYHDHITVNTKAPAKRTSKSLPLPPRKMSPFRAPFLSEFPLPSMGRVLIFSGTTQSHDCIARVMLQPLQLPITTCLQATRFYGTLARSRIDSSRICQKPRCHSGVNLDVHMLTLAYSLLSNLRQIRRIRQLFNLVKWKIEQS